MTGWSLRRFRRPAAGVGSLVFLLASVSAVAAPAVHPDMSGFYRATTGLSFTPNTPPSTLQHPPLTPEYAAIYQARVESAAAGKPRGDPTAACIPQGMPRFMNMPFGFEILQTAKQINFYSEWNEQTRRIYTDGRPHPLDADPSYNGHSIGHWEGKTLVVDTVGMRADTVLDASGIPHSDASHVTERIYFVDPQTLHDDLTLDDPKALLHPWTVTKIYRRQKPRTEVAEYVCEENNRNPIDKNGVTTVVKPQ